MKKTIKNILIKLSRFIFLINKAINFVTPIELKRIPKSKLKLKLEENLVEETFENFKEQFKKSMLFSGSHLIREYVITTSLLNDKNKEYYYLEFGVWKGASANFFSKYVNKLHCFDSFEGLKEDWIGTGGPMGDCNLDKKIPKLNSNVQITVGWVEDTLDDFLNKYNPKINFIHFDMDTYSPTKFTLEKLKPYLIKNAIILFDDLHSYIGWENGEYKALKEVFSENEFEYKAFNLSGAQCAIQIK
tara:strand:- start:1380 stop:2114 length:735 start_codon:yes stop_codon:yes gene_type:complete